MRSLLLPELLPGGAAGHLGSCSPSLWRWRTGYFETGLRRRTDIRPHVREGIMAKFFAVTIFVIAIASAIPILRHTWWMAPDISTHGAPIDEQMSETMAEAGISFLASQIILAFFIWRFSNPRPGEKTKSFPGGAKAMVWAAFLLVGTEVLALGVFGVKAWANVYFTPPSANAMPVQVQAGQFAFYFRYPGSDGKFGPIHPEMI